jgi:hypothetical protein
MQLPFGPNPTVDKRREVIGRSVFVQPGQVLSIESQLKLRELYEFIETSRAALNDIRKDLAFFPSGPEDSGSLQKISQRLGRFCTDADSWGFDAMYEIGMRLHELLLNCGSRLREDVFWNTLNRALSMLSALLEQCENDFRWRLAIADALDSLDQLAHN